MSIPNLGTLHFHNRQGSTSLMGSLANTREENLRKVMKMNSQSISISNKMGYDGMSNYIIDPSQRYGNLWVDGLLIWTLVLRDIFGVQGGMPGDIGRFLA